MTSQNKERIRVGPISGFPEWGPAERIVEQQMLDIIRTTFEMYGFSPIETSSVERNEILTAKGSEETERQIYRLTGLHPQTPEDAREYSLHFDLTVPLARYVAQHHSELVFPFKRYQIQKVWRGERPQHGRFREFTQCDIDIVGDESLDLIADAEVPAVIYEIFKALNIGPFNIQISNRKILSGFLESLSLNKLQTSEILKEVDKIDRVGQERLENQLATAGISKSIISSFFTLLGLCGTPEEVLKILTDMKGISEKFEQGVQELQVVVEHANNFGIEGDCLSVDLKIVRGLDYYTGTIYETRLKDHPQLGSICSGGRYEDLASYFINRTLPGVGISIGLTRLFSQLLQANLVSIGSQSIAPVLVTTPEPHSRSNSMKIATLLRTSGIKTETFLDEARLTRQLRYASRKGFAVVLIPFDEDLKAGNIRVRYMDKSEEVSVAYGDLTQILSTYR